MKDVPCSLRSLRLGAERKESFRIPLKSLNTHRAQAPARGLRFATVGFVIRRGPLAGGSLMTCSRISAIPMQEKVHWTFAAPAPFGRGQSRSSCSYGSRFLLKRKRGKCFSRGRFYCGLQFTHDGSNLSPKPLSEREQEGTEPSTGEPVFLTRGRYFRGPPVREFGRWLA